MGLDDCLAETATLTQQLRDKSVELGGELVLVCSGRGNPQPSFSWSIQGAPAVVGGRVSIRENPGAGNGVVSSELRISEFGSSDYGTMSCTLSNVWGTVSSSASVVRMRKYLHVLTVSLCLLLFVAAAAAAFW